MEDPVQKKDIPDVIILANGPGELSSYVRPTVDALDRRPEPKRITILFTPCPYSTGKEIEIARSIPGVSLVINEKEFVNWALWNRPPKVSFHKKGVVVFMGGDILYGKMIAKKLKYPALAYSEAYAKWPKIYKKFLVPDEKIRAKFKRQGFPEGQIKVVGNLMVDSIKITKGRDALFRASGLDRGNKLISFLPGSRYFQVQFTIKYFAKTANELANRRKDLQFSYIISPYLPSGVLEKEIRKAGLQMNNGLIKYKSVEIHVETQDQHDWIAASDLIITIPGTNTAEVAVIGTPMISVFPTASSQMIPLEGIYDIIGKIPGFGFIFKKIYVIIAQSRTRFFAIPNIKAGREIVPDLRGTIQPKDIAEKAVFLLNEPKKLDEMRRGLRSSLGAAGASKRIAEEIMNEAIF